MTNYGLVNAAPIYWEYYPNQMWSWFVQNWDHLGLVIYAGRLQWNEFCNCWFWLGRVLKQFADGVAL